MLWGLWALLTTAAAHGEGGQTEGPRYKPEMMDFEGVSEPKNAGKR